MRSRPFHSRIRTTLLVVAWAAAVAAVIWGAAAYLLGWHRGVHSVEDWRVRVWLTLIGVAVTAAVARWLVYAARVFPKAAATGLIAWLISAVCYLLLVWTSLKVHPTLWRIWWVSLIGTLAAALALALRLPATGRRGILEKSAALCLVLLAVVLITPAFREDVLASPHPLFLWTAAPLAVVVLAGSLVARVRFVRSRAPQPVRRWKRVAWVAVGQVGLLMLGFYLGRITQPAPVPLDRTPFVLSSLTEAQIAEQVQADLQTVEAVAEALEDLRHDARTLHAEFAAARRNEGRRLYTPEEADRLRPMFMSYLACRDAMLRMVATYSGFQHVRDPELRARCFLVGFAAGSTIYAASLNLIDYGKDPVVRRKLNEGEPAWGLAGGQFDKVYASVASDRTAQTFDEMAAYYDLHKRQREQENILPAEQLRQFTRQIDLAVENIGSLDIDRNKARWQLLAARVRADAYDPLYTMQSAVSTWIGDTRLVGRPSFITPEQIKSMQPRLRPGDILLERRNWFASNAFLPGFWPHAALYIGRPEDLEQLGILRRTRDGWTSDDPAVAAKLGTYLQPAHDNQPHTVVESVSEGVIFNSLTESMAADYVAVLRPRKLSDADRAAVIRKAFLQVGKPYDFEFDFATSDKLVCTELVYQCYDSLLDFDCDENTPGEQLPEIMGRRALPALEFCRKFARERASDERELDLVLFLDAVPARGIARETDEEAFCASASRPRGFNE